MEAIIGVISKGGKNPVQTEKFHFIIQVKKEHLYWT